jgi:hypothetical protein
MISDGSENGPDLRGPLDPIMETTENTVMEVSQKQAKKYKKVSSKRFLTSIHEEAARTLSPRSYVPSIKKFKQRVSSRPQTSRPSPRP